MVIDSDLGMCLDLRYSPTSFILVDFQISKNPGLQRTWVICNNRSVIFLGSWSSANRQMKELKRGQKTFTIRSQDRSNMLQFDFSYFDVSFRASKQVNVLHVSS